MIDATHRRSRFLGIGTTTFLAQGALTIFEVAGLGQPLNCILQCCACKHCGYILMTFRQGMPGKSNEISKNFA